MFIYQGEPGNWYGWFTLLEILFGAVTLRGVRAAIPHVLDLLAETIVRLRNGEIRAANRAITTTHDRSGHLGNRRPQGRF